MLEQVHLWLSHYRAGDDIRSMANQTVLQLSFNKNDRELANDMHIVAHDYMFNDKVAVPIDKDAKRRCFMDVKGYLYRMTAGFIMDTKFYTAIPS